MKKFLRSWLEVKSLEESEKDSSLVRELKEQLIELTALIEKRRVLDLVGVCHPKDSTKEWLLLKEANERGFFRNDVYFVPLGSNWAKTAFFRHHKSSLLSAYRYWPENDTLTIPGIGVKGNYSACSVVIYSKGSWAEVIEEVPSKVEEFVEVATNNIMDLVSRSLVAPEYVVSIEATLKDIKGVVGEFVKEEKGKTVIK